MNIIFMGTPTYALPCLEVLAQEHTVGAVLTRPDAVSKRGKKTSPSPVKTLAQKLGILVYTPQSFYAQLDPCKPLLDTRGNRVVDAELMASMEKHDPDLIVVAAYGLILPAEILALPRYGCVNLHASLLPRWRGAAPIQRALLAGDEFLGVSIMRMETGLDTGPYCLQAQVPAANRYYEQLEVQLGVSGAELLATNLDALVQGELEWTVQDESLVTYADKLQKGSIDLDPTLTTTKNYNRVRAGSQHVACRALLHGRRVTILEAYPAHERDKKRVYYECSDGLLEILTLKPDGGKTMAGSAFLAGIR